MQLLMYTDTKMVANCAITICVLFRTYLMHLQYVYLQIFEHAQGTVMSVRWQMAECNACAVSISIVFYILVGSDYTTITGNVDITAVFSKGSSSTLVEILIHHDLLDEGEEYFTAELPSECDDTNTSATITIRDTAIVLCTFDRSVYSVYESVGSVSLTLSSSKAIPRSNFTVQVDTVYGIGNASGECCCKSHDK